MKMANLRIKEMERLPSFNELRRRLPLSARAIETVIKARDEISKIVTGESKRFLVIVGPCSIHNTRGALEYAERLGNLIPKLGEQIIVVMRVCLDKPRTRKSWEGFFSDPYLDNSYRIKEGISEGRKLMIEINSLGVPIATEALDARNYHYVSDLVSYAWIGTRNIQSQESRKVASGLTPPVGFKNPTYGPLTIALDAIEFAKHPSVFVGPNDDGVSSRIVTEGNPLGHLILRGTISGPNFDEKSVSSAIEQLRLRGLNERLMIDCSHGNSGYNHLKQKDVFLNVLTQRCERTDRIVGIMLESYLQEGNQPFMVNDTASSVRYDISITDGCLGWDDTQELLGRAFFC